MTNNLLVRINRKNDMYLECKSTNNNEEYEIKKINFKFFVNIIDQFHRPCLCYQLQSIEQNMYVIL